MVCKLFSISRQAYYKHCHVVEESHKKVDLILSLVVAIRRRHPRMGTRKLLYMISPVLAKEGYHIGKDGLFSLLASHGLLVRKSRRRVPITTFSSPWYKRYSNLLEGAELAFLPPVLVSDITYLVGTHGFYYLIMITEMKSRMILGYQVSHTMQVVDLCLPALRMAIKNIPEQMRDGMIHHSDRGSQYLSFDYCNLLKLHGIRISTTQSGSPYENALAERLNGIIKNEYLLKPLPSLAEARRKVAESITLYNSDRPHLSLDKMTPLEVWEKSKSWALISYEESQIARKLKCQPKAKLKAKTCKPKTGLNPK